MSGSIMKIAGVEALQQNIIETKTRLEGITVSGISDVRLNNLSNGQVLKYDTAINKWVNRNDDSGGSGLKIGDVSGVETNTTAGVKSVTLKWTDPNDVEVSGVKLAEWSGTLVVRKAGSTPTSKDDGTTITNSRVKNQYSTTGYVDSTVEYGVTYYYRFFPYTTGDLYTDSEAVSATAVKETVAVPVVNDELTYDGTQQTMTFDYDNTKVSLSGTTGTDAGSYTATASLIDSTNTEWSDHTSADKSIAWSISKASVAEPTVTGAFTYDGTQHTATVSTYDTDIISISGLSGTDAGTYTATLHLIDDDNYEWSDTTTADKTQTWTIAKAKLIPPTITGSFTYDGTQKTATVSSYDSTKISVTGITGTDAGTYTATLHIIDDDNYDWTDDTTADKTETWTIAKATGGCTLTPSSVTLDSDHTSRTSVISNATGTVTGVTSGTPAKVSVSLSGDTITVTALDTTSQTVNVTVAIAESSNYQAANVTLTVVCSFLTIVTWSSGTDAQIAAMLDAHYAGSINIYDYWSVGDERVVPLSAMSATGVGESHVAQNVKMVLMNKGGKTLTTPINGHSECAFIVGQKNMLANGTTREGGYMNSSNTNSGGWDSCARRTWCNSVYKNAIPSTLRGIFKQHKNETADGSSTSKKTSNDYFALPSEKEIFGSVTYANSTAEANNTQFKYYETSSNRIKYQGETGGSASTWWERSPRSGNAADFCIVNSSGYAYYDNAFYARGLAPFGCI